MTRQIAVALVALAVMIGATLAADRVVAAPVAPSAAYTEQVDVSSGTWYCVPLPRRDEAATLTVAAVGDEASRVAIENFEDGEATFADERRELAPNETLELELDGAAEAPPAVVVRWSGGPVVASWTADASDGQRLGASCSPSPAPRWLVSGAVTTVGSTTRLYLFNPFDSDAVVRVAFATPEGRQDLVSSENVSVPARQVVDVDITELQPEQPDLGMIVEVEAGRVIATGLQSFGQPDLPEIELEGAELSTDPTAPEGRTVLPATATDATTAGFAYAAAGQATSSWITVLNPNTRPARLTMTASDEIASDTGGEELVVAPESVARIELDSASSSPNFGVALRSTNDTTFVANGFLALTGDDKRVAAIPGVTALDRSSAQAAAPDGSNPEVAVFNPGDTTATLAINIGGSAPGTWSSVEVAPGAMELLPAADEGVDGGSPVTIAADQPVYGALRLSAEDRVAGLLTLPLLPAASWTGSAEAVAPERDQTLETRRVDFPVQPES
ncbi:hypothetical protein BH23ACT10_BH23ACT10_35920 [soil metagenome]